MNKKFMLLPLLAAGVLNMSAKDKQPNIIFILADDMGY